MGVYTKTGDKGETSLYTGQRVPKNSPRVETYGMIDEMNSALAMARAFSQKDEVKNLIFALQKDVSLLMADFASLDQPAYITDEKISALEKEMDRIEAKVGKLTKFVVPGDTKAGACLDLARTIARRAERQMLRLAANPEEKIHTSDKIYLNRLSDYCFMLMRLEDFNEEN